MPNIPSLVEMLESGVHFGHRTSRWHPKMEPFIFGTRGGIHIIDLETTQDQLKAALEFVKGIASRGGTVLFVGTKPQAKDIVKKYAEDAGMPYVTERWLGGTLTNFVQLKVLIKRFKTLREQQEKGELRKYTKKEQLLLDREIKEMNFKIGGIQNLTKTPEAIFAIDTRAEKTAVQEAKKIGTKVIAICDTNINPEKIDYVIPANADAVKSIELITQLVSEAIKEGKAAPAKEPTAAEKEAVATKKEPIANKEENIKV